MVKFKSVLSIFSIVLLGNLNSFAQETKKNSIYLEALGNGVVYSINYDRIFRLSDNIKLAPRVGIEYIPRSERNVYGKFNFPTEINFLINKNKNNPNFIETGIGLNFFSINDGYEYDLTGDILNEKYRLGKVSTVRIGYRRQKPSGGLMYRAGILVKLSQDEFSKSRVGDDLFYRLWPGFSIGYTF